MSLASIPRAIRQAVFRRDAGRCRYCGLRQVGQAAVFHINHVNPSSRGGATALVNPLEQDCPAHFALQADETCVGLTPVGRATVEALRMNDPLPRTARAMQVTLGLA